MSRRADLIDNIQRALDELANLDPVDDGPSVEFPPLQLHHIAYLAGNHIAQEPCGPCTRIHEKIRNWRES